MTDLGSAEFWERIQAEPARLAAEVCFVDVARIEDALQKHASLFAWVAASHELAKIEEEQAKWALTVARARALLAATGTVDERKAAADTADSVQAAQAVVFAMQEKRGALRAMADALEHRQQMLVQIAAKQRQEDKNYNR